MIAEVLRVLVVEPDPALRRDFASALEQAGHGVDVAPRGDAAVRLAAATTFDVVVLDAALPGPAGASACRALRRLHPAVPILLLIGARDGTDPLRDPACGADAWLRKPVSHADLVARIRALRRHALASRIAPEALDVDGIHLDLARRCVLRDGRPVPLTTREVGILRWLYNHRTRAVSRAELLEEVWGVPGDLRTRTVDMTISNLRRKIEQRAATPRIIVTVKGCGYVWGAAG